MADVVNNGAVNKTKWGIEADKLNAKFNSVDSDLSTVNGRLDGVDSSMTTVNGRLDGVDSDITTVNGRLDGVDSSLTTVNGRVDGIDSDITTLTRTQAIQILKQQDSSLILQGFAKPGDDTPVATLNHAYIVTESGTVFGVEATEGQVLVGNESVFEVKDIASIKEFVNKEPKRRYIFQNFGFLISKLNGAALSYSDYRCTDFIPIHPNGSFIVRGYNMGGASSSCLVAFYDINKVFLSPFDTSGHPDGYFDNIEVEISANIIPENARYVRCTGKIEYPEQYLIFPVNYGVDAKYVLSKELPVVINENPALPNFAYVFAGTGTLNSSALRMRCTNFIECAGYSKLKYMSSVHSSQTTAGIAFYDENENYISGVYNLVKSEETSELRVVDIPEGAYYVRMTAWNIEVIPLAKPFVYAMYKDNELVYPFDINSISNNFKNKDKTVAVFGGSHTVRAESEAAKDIWRRDLGLTVYSAGVGSTAFIQSTSLLAWINNGKIVYTRDSIPTSASMIWDDWGVLSGLSVISGNSESIELSDGLIYNRTNTDDWVVNIQEKVKRITQPASLSMDIYLFWMSTNDYYYAQPLGNYNDYTAEDNYDVTKIYQDPVNIGTVCGGFNNCVKMIRDKNPNAEIYIFTSLRYFSDNEAGYNPYTDVVRTGNTVNFYEYHQEVLKAARKSGIAIFDQFMIQGVDINNYQQFYEADNIHMNTAGYEKIGYIQAEFLKNGK